MSRVLVTGATGGLGLATVAAFAAAGVAVRATGRKVEVAARLEAVGAEFVPADLTNPSALTALVAGCDGVVHCAALSSPWGRYADFHRINVAATRNLLNAARSAGVRRFVFVSSPSVYARPADQVDLTEGDPINPRPMNAYAATKSLAEREVLAASDDAMACVAVRPRAIVGPDDQVLLPRVLRLVRAGRFPLIRGGKALVQLTDARDAAASLLLTYQKAETVAGEVFNVSGGLSLTIRAMAENLAAAIGRELHFVSVPYATVAAVATVSEAVCNLLPGRPEPRLTPYSLTTVAFSQTFNLAKARDVLGYTPRYDAFATALEVARHGG